ncbi:DUF6286 domain-containing protein [Streptomyces sp. KR80]|uniref:DUF6286 domain-containing protein n=1 Tax=Streptomyces sp. KR80 TaxID=3457426 RepID=UPI003FD1FCDE
MTDDERDARDTGRMPPVERASGPEQSASAAVYEGGGESERVRRFWSERRVPAAIVAALCVAGLGLLLYDVAAVRADRTAMEWRRRLADELAERPLDDPWMIGGAVAAMVLGLWLIVLALTPGLRRLLPMLPPSEAADADDVQAGIHRDAAALVLRDRAMEVSGVQSVRVDVRRGRVRARALAHFRELDKVRSDLDAALAVGLQELGLVRQPTLSVHVRRPAKR